MGVSGEVSCPRTQRVIMREGSTGGPIGGGPIKERLSICTYETQNWPQAVVYVEWGPQTVKRGLLPGRVQRIRVCWVHPEMRVKQKS